MKDLDKIKRKFQKNEFLVEVFKYMVELYEKSNEYMYDMKVININVKDILDKFNITHSAYKNIINILEKNNLIVMLNNKTISINKFNKSLLEV